MKVLLIEDHPIVRAGCRRLLQDHAREDDAVDVLEASTGQEGVALNAAASPDIAVLDLHLPDMPGMEVLRLMREQTPQLRVIVFSMYEDAPFVTSALEAGARGYVTKNDDPESMVEAIECVRTGGLFLAPRVAELLAQRPSHDSDPLKALTAREREVFDVLGQGLSLAEIAAQLGISYRTVANAAAQIRMKLKLGSGAALIKHAVDRSRRDQP
jgi:two-component system, NarL family, invasion response regulator UvrY